MDHSDFEKNFVVQDKSIYYVVHGKAASIDICSEKYIRDTNLIKAIRKLAYPKTDEKKN
jgi:hypothetical protein